MSKKSEFGLMIIWERARNKEQLIMEDVRLHFSIRNIIDVTWSKEQFSKNLTRFYGEKLPPNSFKEKHCGNGTFRVLIIVDEDPVYAWRPTSHGKEYVNVHFFDCKEMYRSWTGQHRVHCTNNEKEFRHDLMMLFGKTISDFVSEYREGRFFNYTDDIIGSDGWESLQQVFYVLNETAIYLVLRNFDQLPENAMLGSHSDLDILCKSVFNISTILNAQSTSKNKRRSQYRLQIGNNYLNCDLRYPGDGYYDRKWEENMLASRRKRKCFYIPSEEHYRYSLLYHALIQKKKIDELYLKMFMEQYGNDVNEEKLFYILKQYMDINEYSFCPAKDYSVYFNSKLAGEPANPKQVLYFKCYPILRLFIRVTGK